MPDLVEYADPLDDGVAIAVRFVTEDGVLVRYAVVLLVGDRDEARPVRLFDNTHGVHEMHRYTRDGYKQPPELFHSGTPSEAMNAAKAWITDGWRGMIDGWQT
jgi:hypothetical protein